MIGDCNRHLSKEFHRRLWLRHWLHTLNASLGCQKHRAERGEGEGEAWESTIFPIHSATGEDWHLSHRAWRPGLATIPHVNWQGRSPSMLHSVRGDSTRRNVFLNIVNRVPKLVSLMGISSQMSAGRSPWSAPTGRLASRPGANQVFPTVSLSLATTEFLLRFLATSGCPGWQGLGSACFLNVTGVGTVLTWLVVFCYLLGNTKQ